MAPLKSCPEAEEVLVVPGGKRVERVREQQGMYVWHSRQEGLQQVGPHVAKQPGTSLKTGRDRAAK